jgi:hypothetical protein
MKPGSLFRYWRTFVFGGNYLRRDGGLNWRPPILKMLWKWATTKGYPLRWLSWKTTPR